MGATAVQVDNRAKYERTSDPKRMLTHALLNEAIRKDSQSTNVLELLPARTATSIRYGRGAKTAQAWNEDEKETTIDLPPNDGWYVPDGNPFAIPNGKKSNRDDPEALYLVRHQDREFVGPLGRGDGWYGYDWVRLVYAYDYWSYASGVALIGREAAAPLVVVPSEKLANITDPKVLAQRTEQLETAAKELTERLGAVLSAEAYARLIKPILDEAAFLRELAGKIEAIQQKA